MSGWLIPLLVGAATGVLSGFGVGGGTLLLVYMTTLAGLDQHLAQGINLLYFLPTAGASLIGHIRNQLIDYKVFLWTAIPGVLATIASSIFLGTLDITWVRRIFGLFLLFILWKGKR